MKQGENYTAYQQGNQWFGLIQKSPQDKTPKYKFF